MKMTASGMLFNDPCKKHRLLCKEARALSFFFHNTCDIRSFLTDNSLLARFMQIIINPIERAYAA